VDPLQGLGSLVAWDSHGKERFMAGRIKQFFDWVPRSILDYLDRNAPEPQQPEPRGHDETQTIVSKLGDLSADDQAEVDKFIQYLKSRRTNGRDT
jgi:hypothetical protein